MFSLSLSVYLTPQNPAYCVPINKSFLYILYAHALVLAETLELIHWMLIHWSFTLQVLMSRVGYSFLNLAKWSLTFIFKTCCFTNVRNKPDGNH